MGAILTPFAMANPRFILANFEIHAAASVSRNRYYIGLADGGKICKVCRGLLCGVIVAGGSRPTAVTQLLKLSLLFLLAVVYSSNDEILRE
jgi:hypothetical protein